jgi:hypothetical protein
MRASGALLTRDDLRHLPRIEPLIDDHILGLRTTALVYGKRASLKSFVTLGWAGSVSTGTPWLGRATIQTPVLYVVGEGVHGLPARVEAWERAWKQPMDGVTFAPMRRLWSDAGKPLLAGVTAAALDVGARLVVLDTLSSLFIGADELNGVHMGAVTDGLNELRDRIDGTTVLVHHAGKDVGRGGRGHSSLEANVDAVILVERGEDIATLTCQKSKDWAEWSLHLRAKTVDLGTDEDGKPLSSLVMEEPRSIERERSLSERAMGVLAEAGDYGMTARELILALGLSDTQRSALYGALSRAVNRGELVKVGQRFQPGGGAR